MKLLILASHPVQYHAPYFREISKRILEKGGQCKVIYLSDFSMQGYKDTGFGATIKWDSDLMDGYDYCVLDSSKKNNPSFFDLRSLGFMDRVKEYQPTLILFTTLNYIGAINALIACRLRLIPCAVRVETNDMANFRGVLKTIMRDLYFRAVYSCFKFAIAIGTLNRQHLSRLGVKKIETAYYAHPDFCNSYSEEEKQCLYKNTRKSMDLSDRDIVLLFCGKLTVKKNPTLLMDKLNSLPDELKNRLFFLFVGDGELRSQIEHKAKGLGLRSLVTGFKQQNELAPYYLCSNIFYLCSQQKGETWGLVVNNAIYAGLPCIISSHVGCSADVGDKEHMYIINEADTLKFHQMIHQYANFQRNFHLHQAWQDDFSTYNSAKKTVDFLTGSVSTKL